MKLITLILSLSLGLATTAFSNSKFDNWTYSDLPPLAVALDDQATGGCWTNIGEVQTYAEDKLRVAGANVIEIKKGGKINPAVARREAALFHVRVKAERNGFGFCWGLMHIDLIIGSTVNNINGVFVFANTASTLMRNENVNNDILDMVGKVVPRWSVKD